MDSIQTKIEAIKADKNNLKTACVAPRSLCNIKVSEGRVIIANQYKMSPLEVTDIMKVDREVPKVTYCIAIPDNVLPDMLGREVVLDMSYGGKGVPLSHKIKNLDKKLIDVLGGDDIQNLIQSFCFHPLPPNTNLVLYKLFSFLKRQSNHTHPAG